MCKSNCSFHINWKPIETAPKDCAFLGYLAINSELWIIAPMYWCGTEFLFVQFHSDNTEHSVKPTHWLSLPSAPIDKELND